VATGTIPEFYKVLKESGVPVNLEIFRPAKLEK
jgi:hypothetical protein